MIAGFNVATAQILDHCSIVCTSAPQLRRRERRSEEGLAEVERWRGAQADDARMAAAEAEDRADAIVSRLDCPDCAARLVGPIMSEHMLGGMMSD